LICRREQRWLEVKLIDKADPSAVS
jgi:hypothetical protein